MTAASPCAPSPVVTRRSWSGRDGGDRWTYTIGFDPAGAPVRFEIERPDRAVLGGDGPEDGLRPLLEGWRMANGAWFGRYRCATGCATAPLTPGEIECIETAARMALLAGVPE